MFCVIEVAFQICDCGIKYPHARFELRGPGHILRLPFVFSQQAARIQRGMIVTRGLAPVGAILTEADIHATKLPKGLHRLDELSAMMDPCGLDTIKRYEGRNVTLLEEGAGRACFDRCHSGKLCGFINCAKYPPHGAFFTRGASERISGIVFSDFAALVIYKGLLEAGLFEQGDLHRVTQDMHSARLGNDEAHERADCSIQYNFLALLNGNPCFIPMNKIMNDIFGIQVFGDFVQFAKCQDGYRLRPFYEYLPEFAVIHSRKMARDAVTVLKLGGFISLKMERRLQTEIESLQLPETSADDVPLLDNFTDRITDLSYISPHHMRVTSPV